MIRPSEISKLAHQLGLDDKTIEKDYVLTWVLLALAASPLCELLAFKGALPSRRCTSLRDENHTWSTVTCAIIYTTPPEIASPA
jgi:hypothetical protein